MEKILVWLDGKKTYIVAILAAVYNIGLAFQWWTADNQYVTLVNTVLATFGLAFLRAGVSKSGK